MAGYVFPDQERAGLPLLVFLGVFSIGIYAMHCVKESN
jgi:hypothetical protein